LVTLHFDEGRQVVHEECAHCGTPQTRVTGFVLRDGDAYAIYLASCYHHDGHEVWIDAIFSPTWEEEVHDRYSFGCRVGSIDGGDVAASMVDAAGIWDDSPMYGRKLSREDGLAHPQRDEFWALVDHILVNDPDVAVHMGYAREEGDLARPLSALLVSMRGRLRRALLNPRRGA
jgi:hypothetical protein